jgi:hypothetical protein
VTRRSNIDMAADAAAYEFSSPEMRPAPWASSTLAVKAGTTTE